MVVVLRVFAVGVGGGWPLFEKESTAVVERADGGEAPSHPLLYVSLPRRRCPSHTSRDRSATS